MTVIVPEEEAHQIVEKINRAFAGRLRAVTSGFGAVDIVQDGIDKAWGLKQLMAKWQIKPDQVMAFGDNHNDMEMLELATYSYAVANATPDVKERCRFQAPSNEEEGVFQVIEAYLTELEKRK